MPGTAGITWPSLHFANGVRQLPAKFGDPVEIVCTHTVGWKIDHWTGIDIITTTERLDRFFKEDGFPDASRSAQNDELAIDLTSRDIVESASPVAEVKGAPGAQHGICLRPGERVPPDIAAHHHGVCSRRRARISSSLIGIESYQNYPIFGKRDAENPLAA